MGSHLYPSQLPRFAKQRMELTPEQMKAFRAFSKAVFAGGALDKKTKQLIGVAVAHVTQCPYCIRGHRGRRCGRGRRIRS